MTALPETLGHLRESGYVSRSVKDEMRENLLARIRSDAALFPGIRGYEQTVLPQIENAILSRHDMLFLGLRGQGKTRILRLLNQLLDEKIPIVAGSEINDDPLRPVSRFARNLVAEHGDATPIAWVGREERYQEKLATPDVTIADLIGELDLIKHAEGRHLSSEDVMHFGLIPRSHRGIFCMNELPDLSPKIQVGLFNVLEERDIQIRGFPVRLELDLCMVFSANPEDYTNRGRIVTPLKDRIGSVIRTHYPLTRDLGIQITDENAWLHRTGGPRIIVPRYMKEIIEETSRLARSSPHVNPASGVSVRMSIANFENMISSAERRAIRNGLSLAIPRVSDLSHLAASSRGKMELNMTEEAGEEDRLVQRLISEATRTIFDQHFSPKQFRKLVEFFEAGEKWEVGDRTGSDELAGRIKSIPGLDEAINRFIATIDERIDGPEGHQELCASVLEWILEGLHCHNRLNKTLKDGESIYGF